MRKIILEAFDMSLGTGLGKLAGKVFRIGHLGDFNDLTLAGHARRRRDGPCARRRAGQKEKACRRRWNYLAECAQGASAYKPPKQLESRDGGVT